MDIIDKHNCQSSTNFTYLYILCMYIYICIYTYRKGKERKWCWIQVMVAENCGGMQPHIPNTNHNRVAIEKNGAVCMGARILQHTCTNFSLGCAHHCDSGDAGQSFMARPLQALQQTKTHDCCLVASATLWKTAPTNRTRAVVRTSSDLG